MKKTNLLMVLGIVAASTGSMVMSYQAGKASGVACSRDDSRDALLENMNHSTMIYSYVSDGRGKTKSQTMYFSRNGDLVWDENAEPGRLP